MPDWYVRKNDEGSVFPYSVRLGGCEYSLDHEQWAALTTAFHLVDSGQVDCVESEGYQDLVIASSDNKPKLSDIMGLAKPNINRRGM
jgi:hypothetical protein